MREAQRLTEALGEGSSESATDFLDGVAVLMLTYNEAPNIPRTLDRLKRFPEVVVLDSGSTDATCAIARQYPNVRIAVREFDQHSRQWTYGLTSCGIERPWVLALDADFLLPPSLVDEIAALPRSTNLTAYSARFRYCVNGRPLRSSIYPSRVVLYRRTQAVYYQDGHTQRISVEGRTGKLRESIYHDDRKPLSRWLASQQAYARLEAEHLLSKQRSELRHLERLRLLAAPAPFLVFIYTLLVKRCLLDGRLGWFYVLQRTLAEIMLALEILDRKM